MALINKLTAIADAIRNKTGSAESLTLEQMVTEINELEVGGGDAAEKLKQVVDGSITSLSAEDLEGASKISNYVFYGCESLTSITIPDSVTSIGVYAFRDCESLASVTIGSGVTSIGESAFYGCESLTSITIPDSVTNIGSSAFRDCKSLTSITIPDSVTSIGTWALAWCTSLTSITIPDGVTIVKNYALAQCRGLMSVTIGSGVTSINTAAFLSCVALERVDFSKVSVVPTLAGTDAFSDVPSSCQVIVPDALYDEWVDATNWSALTITYVKASEVTA